MILNDRFAEKESQKNTPIQEETGEEIKPVQCEARTEEGEKCTETAVPGKKFCKKHMDYQAEESLLNDVQQIMRDLSD